MLRPICKLVVNAQDSGAERQELGNDEHGVRSNVVLIAYQQAGKRERDGCEKRGGRN